MVCFRFCATQFSMSMDGTLKSAKFYFYFSFHLMVKKKFVNFLFIFLHFFFFFVFEVSIINFRRFVLRDYLRKINF